MLAYRSLCMFYLKLHQQKSSCKCPVNLRKGKGTLKEYDQGQLKEKGKRIHPKGQYWADKWIYQGIFHLASAKSQFWPSNNMITATI